ncbi:MAG: nucleotide-binding protein [Bacteroidetes bacterium GWF2_41_31]|nr:MAG: nucleotide-binding protein [Bacteroidetes bacterium GWF2_41_31]
MISNSVVIDTNLIFSALIPKASKIREILFESNMTFYSPNFLITEIYTHKDKLLKSSKLTESEFYLYFNGIIERIKFIPTDYIGNDSRQKAYDLCKDVDIKDTPFIALAIDLGIPIWTGDKKLKDGLRLKGFQDFYNQ